MYSSAESGRAQGFLFTDFLFNGILVNEPREFSPFSSLNQYEVKKVDFISGKKWHFSYQSFYSSCLLSQSFRKDCNVRKTLSRERLARLWMWDGLIVRSKGGTLQLKMTGAWEQKGEGWGLNVASGWVDMTKKSQYHQVRPPVIAEAQLRAIKTAA